MEIHLEEKAGQAGVWGVSLPLEALGGLPTPTSALPAWPALSSHGGREGDRTGVLRAPWGGFNEFPETGQGQQVHLSGQPRLGGKKKRTSTGSLPPGRKEDGTASRQWLRHLGGLAACRDAGKAHP